MSGTRAEADGRGPGERALAEAQRQGIAAAGAVFDRLLEGIEGLAPSGPGLERPERGGAEVQGDPVRLLQARSAVARILDLYGNLFQQTFDTYAVIAQGLVRPRSAPDPGSAPLTLTGSPGGGAAATVWIHNLTPEPLTSTELRLTDLFAHDGSTVPAACGTFLPPAIEAGAGASASTSLSVTVPPWTAPGVYYGHVLAIGLPGSGLPVCVTVERVQPWA